MDHYILLSRYSQTFKSFKYFIFINYASMYVFMCLSLNRILDLDLLGEIILTF